MDVKGTLAEYGLTEELYEAMLKDISDKTNKCSDLEWADIVDKYNMDMHYDTLRKGATPPLFGGVFVKEYFEDKIARLSIDGTDTSYIDDKLREIQKERVKLRDERNELNRVIREEARKESYKEQVIRSISEYQCSPLLYDESKKFTGVLKSDNDMIISFTDIHAGIEIDNHFNKFNEDVLRDRLNRYLDKIFEVQLRHGSENAFVILSELVSGLIHTELRIESNQNLIEQFLMIMNYTSQFLTELSYRFNTVNVYVVDGNHSRLSPKKEDSLKGENIDNLAIPFLQAKLQNFKNILFYKNEVDESIATFEVRGNLIASSHGDKDNPDTVVQKFTMFLSAQPDIIYLGHRHTNGMTTVYNTKVIESGCLSGSDSYCMDKRLKNKPEQTISIVTEDGLDCLYDVKF